ncbi:MAG: ABC transporter substrate-binding protein [Alphaproteobacteria bacterium]|nr:MAG: ABC transporter substrate-binding protein [Alphaproteobacteria bacterium]
MRRSPISAAIRGCGKRPAARLRVTIGRRRKHKRRPMNRSGMLAASLCLGAGLVLGPAANAADTISVGTVGQASANLWPVFIGLDKGFFAAENLNLDVLYVQSSAQIVQQLTSGSLEVSISTGLVDPMRAIGMGAPIAVVRVEIQAPPYAMLAKPSIKSLKELKGKVVSLGGPKDITRIYVERMLEPNGVKPGEFDMVFAGATVARASALLAGAVDAAILLPPFNFQTEAAGFNNLGLTIDYARDLPFSGIAVNARWANEHKALLQRILAAHTRSIAWFEDDRNRNEAVRILVAASKLKQEDVEKAYDFMRKGHFFESSGKVSRSKMSALSKAMVSLGDLAETIDVSRVVLPGVSELTD